MVAFFVVVILAAVAIYLGALYLQRKYNEEIKTGKDKVKQMTETELSADFANLSRLHLTGQSLDEFKEVDREYRYLINRQLPEISENLNDLTGMVANYKLFSARKDLKIIDEQVDNAQERFSDIKKKLQGIQKNTEDQQKMILKLKKRYQEIRKTLLAKNFSFGPAIDKLEEMLSQLEDEFEEYTQLTEDGDFVKSEKPLKQLEKDTSKMERNIEVIPPLYNNLKNVFPQQLSELQAGFAKMKDEGYMFTQNLGQMLSDIQSECDQNMVDLTNLKIAEAQANNKGIADEIDDIYDILSREYTARQKVEHQTKELEEFINHAEKHQLELMNELDRLQQNYELNNNELEDAHELDQKIKQISNRYTNYIDREDDEKVVYTDVLSRFKEMMAELKKAEQEQQKIQKGVADLWEEEQEAQRAVSEFDVRIHKMRRKIEKLNLPGLSNEYTDYFFQVGDEIEDLDKALNRVRINMEEITKAMINTQSDLDVLGRKTDDIIDSSILAERLMQYSNRYKTRYPEVAAAYDEAYKLFNHDYDYVGALDVISHAVDKVEPGTFKRISDEYQQQAHTNK